MNPYDTLNDLDTLIQSRSILRHPFYVAWREGKLTKNQLATYARVYWPHVATFPSYLETSIAKTDDPVVRETLRCNLRDEQTNPKPHPELWLDFATSFGQSRQEVLTAPRHQSADQIVNTFETLTSASTLEGVTALYVYEVQQPEVASQKMDGLRTHYGIDDDKSLAYFTVHAEADITHSQEEREMLRRCLDDGGEPGTVINAAMESLNAYWGLLDGVCEETAIPMDY
jgi:pyrroloquinoline-quinone synthase